MPVKRAYQPVTVSVTDSGRLLTDPPPYRLAPGGSGQYASYVGFAPSDYTEKVNFERFQGTERKCAGWDYPAPMDDWLATALGTFDPVIPCEAHRGILRPNGKYAIVGCGGGLIKVFSYDADAWLTIGSGYSVDGDPGFTYWQIEEVAGYAVFNNSRDLPCLWQVGDAAVTPHYEFREQGYASAGCMVEYFGILMFKNILEIDPSAMAALMNGPNAFGTVIENGPVLTTRIGFERVWSNNGAPNDFAAVVGGSITATTQALVLAWPMPSFHVGDQIIILGAGTAGGNLTTIIQTISGVHVTVQDAAVTTVVNAPTSQATAISSVVGSDQLEGDGSEIIATIKLKNQLLDFKSSGDIFQSYYTGDVDQPFSSQQISTTKRAIRFPRTLVNVLDQYVMFAGAKQFFTYQLSAQAPIQQSMMLGAQKTLFFDRVTNAAIYSVWAANNAATGEIWFAYPMGDDEEEMGYTEYTARRVLVLNYNEGEESLNEIDNFNFLSAGSVLKPTAGFTGDEQEVWFLMGDGFGRMTLYGRTSTQLLTQLRYGEAFDSILAGGLESFYGETIDKYLKRLTIIMANPEASGPMTLNIYGTTIATVAPVLLVQKVVTDPAFPGVINCHLRRAYFKYRLVTDVDDELRIAAHVWLVAAQDIDQVSQI